MKKLRQSAAAILAVIMLVSLMTINVSAAGTTTTTSSGFSDATSITNTEAVSMMVELGIINGITNSDGTTKFAPADNVTRAQMAKMVSVSLSGGADRGAVYSAMNTGLTDISANWAKGYINHCYSLGIIAGMGDGTFNPDGTVTGAQAAKMLLVALGYDATAQGLVGSDWQINTISLASSVGLLDGLTVDMTQPLSRDNTAQMIYNALSATMVSDVNGVITTKTTSGYDLVTIGDESAIVSVDVDMTILNSVFDVTTIEGVLDGNEYTGLAAGYSTIDGIRYHVSTGTDLIGHQVKLYVKVDSSKQTYQLTVFGGAVDTSSKVSATQTAAFSTNAYYKSTSYTSFLKTNGMSDGIDANATYFVNYEEVTATASEIAAAAQALEYGQILQMIDYDGDADADAVLITSPVVNRVYKNDTTNDLVKFDLQLSATDTSTYIDYADIIGDYSALAADDFVYITAIGDQYLVESAKTVSGTLTSIGSTTAILAGITYYFFSGPTISNYDAADYAYSFGGVYSADKYLNSSSADKLQVGSDYTFVLDANGYVCYVDTTTTRDTSYPISYVVAFSVDSSTSGVSGSADTYSASVVFDNGTTGVYDVYSIDGIKMTSADSAATTTAAGYLAANITAGTTDNTILTTKDANLGYGFYYATLSNGQLVLKTATTKYSLTAGTLTANTTEKGTSRVAAKAYANSETNYFYVDYASTGAINTAGTEGYLDLDQVNLYNGYAAAPSVDAADEDYLYYTNSSGVKVVVAVSYGAGTISTSSSDLYFYAGTSYTKVADDGTTYYAAKLFKDGVAAEYKVDTLPADGVGYYTIDSIDSNGYYTFSIVADNTDFDNAGNVEKATLVDIYGGYIDITVGTTSYSIACSDSVPVVDISGYALIDTMDELSTYVDNYTVNIGVNTDDDGNVVAIYVYYISAT